MPPEPLDGVLAGLTEGQRRAVTAPEAPLCVVAAAGSGKTRVLSRRVARRVLDGSAEAGHVLVVTFTRRAAGELRGRLGRLGVDGVWAGTFHAAAHEVLRRHWADRGLHPPAVVDGPRRAVRALLGPDTAPAEVEAVAAELEWAGARQLGPAGYPAAAERAGRRPPGGPARVAELLGAYAERKRRRHVVDLADLLTGAAELLETDPAAAAACRWRWQHLFVDEFQDVNPAQWRLCRAWLGDRPDLFVVGDPDQAVYGWNGADPSFLDRLPDLLPGTRLLRLDEHHRCSPQVVRAARTVLPAGPVPACTRPDGPVPVVAAFADERAEALAVARFLRRAHRPGRPWSHLAVLARSHARLGAVAEALDGAAIPYRHRTGDGRARWRAARRALAATPPGRPLRGGLAALADGGIVGADDSDPLGAALRRLADELAAVDPAPTVDGFLAWLAATGWRAEELDGPADAVTVATFHQAKGLEWPAVALVGLEDGLVPVAHARTDEARAEERRLLYVAMTRAEEELWLSWAATGSGGAGRPTREPSPFLDGVAAATGLPPGPDPAAARRRVGELRARLLAG